MSARDQQQMPNTTLVSISSALYDAKGFVDVSGAWSYKRLVIRHAWVVFRTTAPLVMWLCFFIGAAIVVQGTNTIRLIGADPGISGIGVGALGLREISIGVFLLGLSASAGAGFVTELGAMRVAEEIDALEVMGIDSHSYLITTRLWGTMIAAVPLVVFAIATVFAGGWLAALSQSDVMSIGSYSRWFWLSIAVADFPYALIKGATLAGVTTMICTSLGYRASGGPVGVGLAVGRALDLSIVAGQVINLCLTYLFWGTGDTLKL